MRTYIIAEAGVNHNGSLDMALELVDVAARAGADAVKFQTFKAELLVNRSASKAEYQKRQTGEGSQFDMLKALELSLEDHELLARRCRETGIEFLSTAFDLDSAKFLQGLGISRIKVPSGELTNKPFLQALAAFNLPLILSTGMANLQEVRDALDWVLPLNTQVSVLHCTSNYPAAASDVNLRAMQTMAQAFGLPVGYSDHTLGAHVAVAAVALGASILEKHFSLDKNLPGPDHQASLDPPELVDYVRQVREIEAALGDGVKQPVPSELPVRDLVRRSVVAAVDIQAGQEIGAEMLNLLRPATGIAPAQIEQLLGRKAAKLIPAGTPLQLEMLL